MTLAFSSSKAYISLAALGGIANVKSVAVTAPDPTLKGAQAEIDANARAQDVTKRIIARVSLTNETWNPGFAVSAAKVCKDFRVDGAKTSRLPSQVSLRPVRTNYFCRESVRECSLGVGR